MGFEVFSVVDFAFMKVEQKEKEEGYHVAFHFQILDLLNIKEYMSMNLGEAKKYAQNFKVTIILYILVSHFTASFAAFKTIVVVLKVSDNL